MAVSLKTSSRSRSQASECDRVRSAKLRPSGFCIASYSNSDVPMSNSLNMAFSASDDEAKAEVPTNERSDIDLVRLQNQPLCKRDADANVPDRRRTGLPGC
ncbi:hypothetical protein GQ600_11914 [Phytophthora cactorum]|nr:hypothetical protein GQ600_11914 [Phytophthora cactorum]